MEKIKLVMDLVTGFWPAVVAFGVLLGLGKKLWNRLNDVYKMLTPNGGSSLSDKIGKLQEGQHIANERWKILWKNISTPYFECDKDGKMTFANQALCELFGLWEEDMEGTGWLTAVDERDRASIWENWVHAIEVNIPFSATFVVISQRKLGNGGRSSCVRMTATGARGEKGGMIRFFGTIEKVGERESKLLAE